MYGYLVHILIGPCVHCPLSISVAIDAIDEYLTFKTDHLGQLFVE